MLGLTLRSEPGEDDIDDIRPRVSRLLKKQEPIDTYFTKLHVGDPRAYGTSRFSPYAPIGYRFSLESGASD